MKHSLSFAIASFVLFLTTPLFAQNKVLSLISERENTELRFWWKSSRPVFTGFDGAFDRALESNRHVESVRPNKGIGKVFRTSTLNDEMAKNIASIFGTSTLIYGELVASGLPKVGNQFGESVQLRVKVLSNRGNSMQRFSSVVYNRNSKEEARELAKNIVAQQLATYLDVFLGKQNEIPSGFQLKEGEILISTSKGKLIRTLADVFKDNGAVLTPIWAAPGRVAYKVSGISAKAIPRIVDRLRSESIHVEEEEKGFGFGIRIEE